MGEEKARAEKSKESEEWEMSEAEFCCDEVQWLADKEQREQERKAQSYDNRIANQREEIRRLHNHIRNLEQSRDAWKAKAERLGKQLHELLKERSEGK
jgi:predicted RNase H-like nuclease (RuvC/YqgF family)